MEGKSPGKKRRKPLTRELVLEAAIELADREGVAALSMRTLARELKVEAMSLYHHVAGKEALLDGMVELVFREIRAPQIGGDWKEELRLRSVSGREVLTRHRWAVGLMDSRSTPGMETVRHHDAVIGCLRAAGFSLPLTAHAFALLDAHLFGFMVQELSLPFQGPEDLGDLAESIQNALPMDEVPHFAEFVVGHALKPGYAFGDEFAYGLDLILEGLERRRSAEALAKP